MDGKKTELIL